MTDTITTQGDLVLGHGTDAELVELVEPVSFYGGVDEETGVIIDPHHPQRGISLVGRAVLIRGSKGSSSSSSTLLECIRRGTAPAALLLTERDALLAVGVAAAFEVYGEGPTVVIVDPVLDTRGASHVVIDGFGRVELLGGCDESGLA